jgi:hypothetical protein
MGALLGCVLGLGASVTLQDASGPSIASAPTSPGLVLRLTFPEAQAQGGGGPKTPKKRAIKRRIEREQGGKVVTPPTEPPARVKRRILTGSDGNDCFYDSYASASQSAELYNCDGAYYRRTVKDGVSTYEKVAKP